MGACLSAVTAPKKKILEEIDGTDIEYHEDYLEDRVLGQGEFGVVKLVHPMNDTNESMAVKILNKGVTFRDNTLFAPLSAASIQTECAILRKLNGEHFNLKLFKLYETRSVIYIVTELCQGGDMMQWVSRMKEDLTVEEVSRISFELIDAVAHCARHGVIHRDIKPENVMFKSKDPHSELRLIDYGSSSIDDTDLTVDTNLEHVTFAGSAFYIAPEMFQHKYSSKIDVWSVGVTLYVLVAGFPAESMQKAFNRLQSVNRKLKELPNMPSNLPEAFFDMLEKQLVYHRKNRATSEEILQCEFVNLHKNFTTMNDEETELDITSVLQDAESFDGRSGRNLSRNGSSKPGTKIIGSVSRHTSYLGYNKFERAVTTLLAAVLSSDEYNKLLDKLSENVSISTKLVTEKRLKVIKVSKLREELELLGMTRA